MARLSAFRLTLRLLLAACLLAQSALASAADPISVPVPVSVANPGPDAAPPARPRIALVLSGGGARGFAHIGVLRALREQHIPVDMVVGTSMGSVVGGAYAAGASLADLERMARGTDWDRVVADRPAREDLEFRRREEDLLLPSRIEFGLHRDGLSLPPSAAGNAALEYALGRLLPAGSRDRQVDQLALPFRSVASDLVTGELVDLVDTPLFLTVRASLAVPGVFAPVRVRQRLVVDGGLVRNLPVDLARRMGADIVIAVNVGTPLAPEKTLGSALGVAQQMINILTEQNVQRSIKELQAHDILIAPDLTGVGFLDFRAVDNAIGAGERATRALAQRLAPLALEREAYAAFESSRLAPLPAADQALPLGRVAVQTDGGINPKILEVQSGLREGQPATSEQVRSAAQALYGRGDLERVEADISDADGKRDVTIRAREAPWADSRLRVGLELGSDFDDANSFALRFLHVRTSMNAWGAELRTMLGVGDERQFGMQFFQPLGPGSPWYLAPSVQYNGATYNVFDKGRRRGRAAVGITGASLIFGRELGAWGDINIGIQRLHGRVRIVVPDAGLLASGSDNALVARYRVDTLDSLAFPSRGVLIDAEFGRARDGSTDVAVSESALVAVKAFRYKEWAGHVYGEFAHAHSPDGLAPSRLGGFLRLSGTEMESIYGRNVALMRLVMARRIGTLPLALGGTVRAGFSLEAGGGFEREATAVGRPFKQAASGFVSVDTRFGPAYFGAGATRSGERTLYLYLGPFW